jgi:hypothetical protein
MLGKGASVWIGVGPFELLLMADGELQLHTSFYLKVFKHDVRSNHNNCEFFVTSGHNSLKSEITLCLLFHRRSMARCLG